MLPGEENSLSFFTTLLSIFYFKHHSFTLDKVDQLGNKHNISHLLSLETLSMGGRDKSLIMSDTAQFTDPDDAGINRLFSVLIGFKT